MKLPKIQAYLQEHDLDGWLLYHFRSQNPMALSVAGLPQGGSRRWFLWISARSIPSWLVHAIETHMFLDAATELQGDVHRYVITSRLGLRRSSSCSGG